MMHRASAALAARGQPGSRRVSYAKSVTEVDNADPGAAALDGIHMGEHIEDINEHSGIPLPYVLNFLQKNVSRHKLIREMFVFVPFLVMFVIFATQGRNVTDDYYIGRVLRDRAMGNEIPTEGGRDDRVAREITRTFKDIVLVSDFFDWISGALIPNLWTCSSERVVKVPIPTQQGLNYLLGSLRIRTLRANRKSCAPDSHLFAQKGKDPPPLCQDVPKGQLWEPPLLKAIGTSYTCFQVQSQLGVVVTSTSKPSGLSSEFVAHLDAEIRVNVVEETTDGRMGRIAGPVAGWIPMFTVNQTNIRRQTCEVECINCLGAFDAAEEETALRFNVSNPLVPKDLRSHPNFRLYQWLSCSQMPGGTYIVGDMDVYHCGGYVVDIPFNESCGRVLEVMDVLRGDGWIQGQTEPKAPFLDSVQSRFASIEYFTYTSMANSFVSVKLFIEIGPSGVVLPRYQIRTFKMWTAHADLASTVYDFFFFAFVLALLVNFGLEWRASWKKTGRKLAFLVDEGAVWHIVEFVNLVILIVVFALRLAWWDTSTKTEGSTFPVQTYPPDLDFLKDLYMTQIYANSFNIVLSFLKILKYCQLSEKLNILTATMSKAKDKVVGVLLLFAWSVFTFALAGHSLFGSSLYGFRNINTSYSTLMRMLLGDFDYEALRRENRILAGVFFWTYITLCLFLLLNFIIAIIGGAFSEAVNEVVDVPFHVSVERFKRSMLTMMKPANLIGGLKLLLKRKSRGHLLDKVLTNMEVYQVHVQQELDGDDEDELVSKEKLKAFMGVEVYTLLGDAYIDALWAELEDDYDFNTANDPDEIEVNETGDLVEAGVAAAIGPCLEGINHMPTMLYELEEKVDDVVQLILKAKRKTVRASRRMFRDNRNRNKRKNDARSGPICSPVQPKVDESQKAKPVVAAAFRHTTPACFAEELQNLRVALSLSERSQDQILDIIIDSMTQRGASLPSTGSKRDKAGTQEQADAGAEAEVETAAKAEETQADVEAKQADTAEATEGDEAPCGEGGQQVEEVAQGVAQTTDDPLAMLSALTAGYHKDRQKKKEQERLKRRLLRRLRSEARVDAAMEVPKAVVPTAAAAALQQQMGTVPESATSATVRVTLAHDSKPAKAKMCVAPRSNTTKDLIALAVAKLSCKNKPKTPLWCYVAGDPKRTPLEGPCLQAVGNEVSLMFTNSVLDGDAPEAKGDKKEKKEKKDKKDKKDKKEKKDKKAVEEEADNSDEEEGDEGQTEYERLEAQEKLLRSRFEGRAVPDSTLIGPRLLNNPRMSTTPPYIARQRQGLPAHKMRSQILATIEANQVSMIVGATGSGKTTQVPQFIAEEREENDMRAGILVVQPRRLAAVSVADRVARERGEQTGRSVGYQVRFESRFNAATTKIGFVTTGMLLNRLMADPTLSGVTHLILDEVHERSSQLDLVLTLLKTGLDQGALPHLRILLLSATLDSSLFAKYFTVGDQSVPILNIPGRTFPVTINFLDDACRFMQHRTPKDPYVEGLNPQDELYPWLLELYGPQRIQSEPLVSPRAEGKINFELVARLVDFIAKARQREGVKACVLIFMPGVSEISSTIQELQRKGGRYETLPLHSMLTSEEQKRIFSEQGERVRVVVSTNLAETSVTIDGVTDVIDSGYVKEFRYSSSFVQTLGTFWVSHASAQQRAGRAGRTMPGTCWRLFSRQVFDMLPRQTLCEMRRSSMTEAVMFAAMLLGRVQDIPRFLGAAPEPPAPTAVQSAFSMLAGIGVFSEVADPQNQFQYFITPLGFHLAHLPVDPHIGKLLLYGAILGCGGMAATVAACLSTSKSLFMTPYKEGRPDREEEKCVKEVRQTGVGHERSDPIAKARIYDAWCRADGAEQRRLIDFYTLSWSALNEVTKLRDMFVRHLKSMGFRVEAVCPEPTPELSASQLRALRQRRARESVMIRCAVVAGLFPHIACPLKTGSHRTLVSLMSGEQCAVNNRSLNHEESLARYGGLVLKDSEFIAYLDQLRFGASTQSYLTDTTVVHGVQLVLFGGRDARLTLKGKKLDSTVLVDGILSFDCKSSETAMLVRVIRQEIENLFADTILSSGSEEVHERAQKLVGAIFMMLEAEVGSLGAAPEESG